MNKKDINLSGAPTRTARKVSEGMGEVKPQGRPKKESAETVCVNTAFNLDNYQFVKLYSVMENKSFTQYVNEIIEDYRTRYKDKEKRFSLFVEEDKK